MHRSEEILMEKAGKLAELRLDRPLQSGAALDSDSLDRRTFASRVTEVLRHISCKAGLVVSVEGAWGSGKTSVLAMVEDLLKDEDEPPVIVHFNPWLIGDRDVLLRQFLASIAKAVKLTDYTKEGKRVAKELKAYSKVFDVLKLIPGAEPWASIIKSVFESVGNTSESIFDYKTPDIEARKEMLEKALREFPQRIVVLLDDVDRLYPAEVYEMVRIIKAIGDLPNIGYVVAWDEKYVSAALDKLNVPFAPGYLDKVVQVRLPIPPLSFSQRRALMSMHLQRLQPEATVSRFPSGNERLGSLFHEGLRDLIEQPRDVARLFDVVAVIEPGLRGEIHLADIFGLAMLMIKAPAIYDLLCRTPQAFVGRRPGEVDSFDKLETIIKKHADERNKVIDGYPYAKGVRDVVHWLFPETAETKNSFIARKAAFLEGHLAHPERLSMALHLSARPGDLSFVSVRQYLFDPSRRDHITATLEPESCVDFISCLGDMAEGLEADVSIDTENLAVAIARLVDGEPFVRRAEERRHGVFTIGAERVAERAIGQIAKRLDESAAHLLAERILGDEKALSMAAIVADASFFEKDRDQNNRVKVTDDGRKQALAGFAKNVEESAKNGELFTKLAPDLVLRTLAHLAPEHCGAVFQSIKRLDPSLDSFVGIMLRHSFDSLKGQSYRLPKDRALIQSFVAIDTLKKHAMERLEDDAMGYPLRAAWTAVIEDKSIYGKDGTFARD